MLSVEIRDHESIVFAHALCRSIQVVTSNYLFDGQELHLIFCDLLRKRTWYKFFGIDRLAKCHLQCNFLRLLNYVERFLMG